MRIIGNILDITNTRDNKLKGVELHINKIEYTTNKKDGRYFQTFEFVDELDTPLVITGDRLARVKDKNLEEGEYEFKVYDKSGDAYELNERKYLAITLEYDFDADLHILSTLIYQEEVSSEEFKKIKDARNKVRKLKSGRGRK